MTEALKEKIVKMAKQYIASKKATFESVGKKFDVSSSKVSKYLNNDLKSIDIVLWGKVQNKKAINIARSRQNFVKPTKGCCIFARLFKK